MRPKFKRTTHVHKAYTNKSLKPLVNPYKPSTGKGQSFLAKVAHTEGSGHPLSMLSAMKVQVVKENRVEGFRG